MIGMMIWAWAGAGRPLDAGLRRVGDPPHEPPGWYSVFDSDASTLELLKGCFDGFEKEQPVRMIGRELIKSNLSTL